MKLPKPPRADQLAAHNGWLTPDGVIYSCDVYGHSALCRQLGYRYLNGFSYDPRLVHLSNGKWLRMADAQPTQSQLNTIWDWCHLRHKRLPHWIDVAKGEEHGQKEDARYREPDTGTRRRRRRR